MSQGLIPYSAFSKEILKYYYSPELILKNTGNEFLNLYCFIAKVDPWVNEESPPLPENSDFYIKNIHKNLVAVKKINSNDICPVIKRIDWKSGTTYGQYSSNRIGEINYYVRNSYDQVFKCLYNGESIIHVNGIASTIEPIIDYTVNFTSNIIFTGDGYKWKYLYTIDPGAKLKFFDQDWIPLPVAEHRKSLSTSILGSGDISVINIYNSGNNYIDDSGNGTTTTIRIDGDGTGATAAAVISGNVLSQILVTNSGKNYTYATANITANFGYSGNGAQLIAEVSPIGGHGYDLISELGCKTIIITTEFNQTEGSTLPTDIDYRQIGLISNPEITVGVTAQFANSSIYRATHDVLLAQGSGAYIQDEIVYQGQLLNPTYSGRVLNFDSINNLLYLINTHGTISINQPLNGTTSKLIRLVLQETIEQLIPYSGNILYIENRKKIQRTSSGLEQFRLTLNY
jgi:hypothetical protein